MLMTVADIEARAGRTFEGEQLTQVESYVADVTALVEDYLGRSFETATPPPAVRAIACREVMAWLNVDPGVASDRVGDVSTSYTDGGAVVGLSERALRQLRRYRRRRGVGSIQVVSHLVPECEEGDGCS